MTDARERLARQFHETYERLAPDFGYETREDTKDFDPTTPNGRLMIAVCGAILDAMPEGPGLPWVSVDERMPDSPTRLGGFLVALEGEHRPFPAAWMEETQRFGPVQLPGWLGGPTFLSPVLAWLEVSSIPLPTDSGWIDAGVHTPFKISSGVYKEPPHFQLRVGAEHSGPWSVMVKPVEGMEKAQD